MADLETKKVIMAKLADHDELFEKIDKRFDRVDKRFDRVEENFHNLGLKFEDSERNQKLILDAVLGMHAKHEKFEDLDTTVADHGDRIAAVEHFVRKHPD